MSAATSARAFGGTGIAPGRGQRALRTVRDEQFRAGYLFLLPALVHFAIFIAFPFGYAFYLSFHEWNMIGSMTFVGFRNYQELLADPTFHETILHTATFTVGVMVGIVVLSLGLALGLDHQIKGMNLFRGIYFSPAVTSVIVVGVVWLWMYQPEFGLINQILALVGIDGPRWVSDPSWAMPSLVLTALWKNVGYFSVIFLAGLQGIDNSFYEAARVDGANRWGTFRHITLPLLMPTTFFVVVMGVILSFQVFGLVYVMTGGGPVGATKVIVFYLYEQAFVFFKMGYASAVAYVLFAIIFVLTVLQFRLIGRHVEL
jgi:multiple sugar transport system permease protein